MFVWTGEQGMRAMQAIQNEMRSGTPVRAVHCEEDDIAVHGQGNAAFNPSNRAIILFPPICSAWKRMQLPVFVGNCFLNLDFCISCRFRCRA